MDEKESKLIAYIKTHVKETDRLESELQKSQILGKRKSKKIRKQNSNKKCKFLTRKDKKAMGLFLLPRKGMKYEEVLPLHALWLDYMKEQLELNGNQIPSVDEKSWDNVSQLVFKADYHGALVSILSSKCPSLVGLSGICIIETKNTLKLIGKDNIIRTVPKEQCEFSFDMGNMKFRIFGKHICKRPAERSVKQSKQFLLSEL